MKMSLKKIVFSLVMMSLVFLSACTGNETSTDLSKDKAVAGSSTNGNKVISVGVMNSFGSMNPINTRDALARRVVGLFFEPLFDVNENMEFIPKLAESFETDDNQTFTIKLDSNANWTDGVPVSSEDVLFTTNLMANPEVQSRGLAPLNIIDGLDENGQLPDGEESIKGIEIIDNKTFTIHTKQPVDPNYLKENFGYFIQFIPKHVLKDVNPAELHQHPFMEKPDVTNGPFKFVKLSPDSYLELHANPEYYRGAPKLTKLFFKVMPSANLVAQLQTGEIQMNFPGVGNIAIQDYEKVKNMANVRTIQGKPFNYQMMYFNTESINHPEVRRAIVYAINRPLIVENLLKGEGGIVDGPFTSAHPYFNEKIENYEYNPEKAKQILEESGWDFNKPINLAVPIGNQTREQAAAIITENLSSIGLKVQINKYDLPTLLDKGAKQEFDLLMLGIPLQIDPGTNLGLFYEKNATYNYAPYDSSKMNDLLKKGRMEPDPEKRKAIYDQAQLLLHDDLPTITLYEDQPIKVVSKNVKVGEPKEYGMFYNVNEWDIE